MAPRRPGPGRLTALILALTLAGCGSDVEALLAQDSELFWEANETITEAYALDPDLAGPVQRAEAAKQAACATLYADMTERVNAGEPSFTDRLLDDLSNFFVRMVPVPAVERCAAAVVAYRRTVLTLAQTLEARAIPVNAVLVSEIGEPRLSDIGGSQ